MIFKLWCCLCAVLFFTNNCSAFLKKGLSSGGHHGGGGGSNKVLIDPGLALFPNGKIHAGPVVLTNVKVVGYAKVGNGYGNGGEGGFGKGNGDAMSGIVGDITDGVDEVVKKGSEIVSSVAQGVGDLVDDKLKNINEKLQPIREKVGDFMANGIGGGGGLGGAGGSGGKGNGGFLGGFGGGLSDKINDIFGGLSNGGPLPMNYGNRIVYRARVRNNRNSIHPRYKAIKSGYGNNNIGHNIGNNIGNGGPRWVKTNCPGAYVGVGFTPDPCPNQIPPCNGNCNQAIGASFGSAGGWA